MCLCNWHAGMFSRLWSIVFEMSLHSLTIMNDRFWTVFSIDDGGQAKLVNSFCQLVIQNILLCLPLSQQFSKGKKNHFSDIWISNFITFLTFSFSFSFLQWHNKVIKNKECLFKETTLIGTYHLQCLLFLSVFQVEDFVSSRSVLTTLVVSPI